ncbi:hypothetical protein [Streptomyces sp. LUP47B]|nr:hypothetical protein [Streptomyces sp. LUP47B]
MTWPDAIALAIGVTTLYLLTRHQHRSTTHQHDTTPQQQDGERP